MQTEYFWDVTLRAFGNTPEEAWDLAQEEFVNSRIPAPKPTLVRPDPTISEGCNHCGDDVSVCGGVTHVNSYDCDQCGHSWQDEWCCACNDECPVCRAEIEPTESEGIR